MMTLNFILVNEVLNCHCYFLIFSELMKGKGRVHSFCVNPFWPNIPFTYTMKTKGLLTFSGVTEKKHWTETG